MSVSLWADSRLLFCGDFDGLALFAPAIEAPGIGKAFALRRLYGLDQALVLAFEIVAGAVGFLDNGKVSPIRTQSRPVLDEVRLAHAHVSRDGADLFLGPDDIARPAAAVAAALAEVGDLRCVKRHEAGRMF